MTSIVSKHGEYIFTDSRLIADKFKKQHKHVLDKIDSLIRDLKSLSAENSADKKNSKYYSEIIFKEQYSEYRGRKLRFFKMNRSAFTILAMGFNGKKALHWKLAFEKAFSDMEHALLNQKLPDWKKTREQGKIARRNETDAIQKFVEYATMQGSNNAKFYYKHITNASYKSLGLIQHKKPAIRETLDILELNQLMTCEIVAERSLLKWMDKNEHYKSIFKLVKQDIENYANSLLLEHK